MQTSRLWGAPWALSILLVVACACRSDGEATASTRVSWAVDATLPTYAEEAVGPFASWIDVRADHGAAGDGVTDDTAAIQMALDASVAASPGAPRVVYLPPGRYAITATLEWTAGIGLGFLGEHPDKTSIVWQGPAGGTMMRVDGVGYSRWGRITWDGAGSAGVGVAHTWNHDRGLYSTAILEHADEVFQDVARGIVGGSMAPGHGWMDADVSIVRSRFLRCWEAGLSIESFNALNYQVLRSEFVDNARGATNAFGAGNFQIYDSVFRRSTVADVTMKSPEYFTLRFNTSIGSRMFVDAEGSATGNPSPTTLHGNRVLDTTEPTAIRLQNYGPLILLDNQIRVGGPPAPPVVIEHWPAGEGVRVASTGNRFARSEPWDGIGPRIGITAQNPRTVVWKDRWVTSDRIDDGEPPPIVVAEKHARPVLEVVPASGGAGIQAAIDQAAALAGQRPVVHLPPGVFEVAETLVIPAGTDVQIVGDSMFWTVLRWTGEGRGPVVRAEGPSRATLRDLSVHGEGLADAIVAVSADQAGGRVLVDQPYFEDIREVGLRVENLDHTRVEVRTPNMHHVGGAAVVQVVGGGAQKAEVSVLGGEVSAGSATQLAIDEVVYDVTGGGRLLVQDTWYEGYGSRLARLTGAGTFTYWAGTVAPYAATKAQPVIEIDGFAGKATMVGLRFHFCTDCPGGEPPDPARALLITPGAATEVLLYGATSMHLADFVDHAPGAGAFSLLHPMLLTTVVATPLADAGAYTTTWLETMWHQSRSFRPSREADVPAGVTDLRLHRVETREALVSLSVQGI